MKTQDDNDLTRRDFLKLSWGLGAGMILPPFLTACGGNKTADPDLFDPPTLTSTNGILDVTFKLEYVNTFLPVRNNDTGVIADAPVRLRSFSSMIPAPTLRINAGDTLRIKIVNDLPPNPPSSDPEHLRYPNSTNLHTHGFHVSPGLIRPGVFGDFVVDDPAFGVKPGETRQHEFKIERDHPAGAYFYHPHLHGSTAIQMASGMAGMIIISGQINTVPEIAAARERVFVLQRPIVDSKGELEDFATIADFPANELGILVNGQRIPRLSMKTGEVQNWHFVNAAIFNFVNLALAGHDLQLYSQDGNPRPNMIAIPPQGNAKGEGVVLGPGNRASVLVKAGRPGIYQLKTLKFQMGRNDETVQNFLKEDVVAEVVVTDEVKVMSLPTAPLPVPPALRPITDQELAAAGGLKRNIVFRAVFNPPPAGSFAKPPITTGEASLVVHPGAEIDDWLFQRGATIANTVFAVGSVGEAASPSPGMPAEFIPFQSHRALKQTVPLGSVEEWTIFNMNEIRHPFHIHVNPIYITKINGVPIEPYWADTIGLPAQGTPDKPTSVTFRSRFTDFKGLYVLHCHMLVHEDMGMMQAVDVV
jgi:FtsP/CotA-like multicopper oxidase with cupredoxin domain